MVLNRCLSPLNAPRFKLVVLPVKAITYMRRDLASYRSDAHLPPAGYRFIEKLKVAAKTFAG